jgi:hypothetical protein
MARAPAWLLAPLLLPPALGLPLVPALGAWPPLPPLGVSRSWLLVVPPQASATSPNSHQTGDHFT